MVLVKVILDPVPPPSAPLVLGLSEGDDGVGNF